jgi:hypothetical protein
MPTQEIRHRSTDAVLFSAELSAEYDGATSSVRLGAAVKLAVKAGAYLSGADLAGANLARADLAGAYLTDAHLVGANLDGANLAYAKDVIDAGTPDGWWCVGWRRDGVVRVRVGCRDKTLAEGGEYWRGKDNRREVMAALDYVESVARARGWIVTDAKESA